MSPGTVTVETKLSLGNLTRLASGEFTATWLVVGEDDHSIFENTQLEKCAAFAREAVKLGRNYRLCLSVVPCVRVQLSYEQWTRALVRG